MGARDQLGVAHVLERAFVGSRDAHRGQLCGHLLRAFTAPAARSAQPLAQLRGVGIEAQAHDVDRLAAKVTEISVPVRYLMPCARAAAAARCCPPISSWSVSDQSSTPLPARAASASGSGCRRRRWNDSAGRALRMDTARSRGGARDCRGRAKRPCEGRGQLDAPACLRMSSCVTRRRRWPLPARARSVEPHGGLPLLRQPGHVDQPAAHALPLRLRQQVHEAVEGLVATERACRLRHLARAAPHRAATAAWP